MNARSLNKLKIKFTHPPLNWAKLVELWESDQPITFYSWECPPRQIQQDPKLGRYVNFDVDIKSIVNGKRLDEFTELPRLTSQPDNERWFIEIIKSNPNTRYVKIIADTNGLYLYPKSLKIFGRTKIKKLSKKFQDLLTERSWDLFRSDSPEIILYSDLQNKFLKEYDLIFYLIYTSFKGKKSKLVPRTIINQWFGRLDNHIGLTRRDQIERLDTLKRVVSSYVAEGVIFDLLDKSGVFPNPVWVNWEEPLNNVATVEISHNQFGLLMPPVIYFLKKEMLS